MNGNETPFSTPPFEGPGPLGLFFQQVGAVLFRPSRFFANMPISGGYARPLTFGLICHWLGQAFLYFRLGFSGARAEDFGLPFETASFIDPKFMIFFSDVNPSRALLDPFYSLFSIFMSAFVLFTTTRLLVPHREGIAPVTFQGVVRVSSYALAPSLLIFIPGLDNFIIPIWTAILGLFGIKTLYQLSWKRSFFIFFFPSILATTLAAVLFFVGAFALFAFFR